MLARAVQTFANDLQQISDAIKGRTVTQIKGTLQKKAFDEAGIVIQQQVQVSCITNIQKIWISQLYKSYRSKGTLKVKIIHLKYCHVLEQKVCHPQIFTNHNFVNL